MPLFIHLLICLLRFKHYIITLALTNIVSITLTHYLVSGLYPGILPAASISLRWAIVIIGTRNLRSIAFCVSESSDSDSDSDSDNSDGGVSKSCDNSADSNNDSDIYIYIYTFYLHFHFPLISVNLWLKCSSPPDYQW